MAASPVRTYTLPAPVGGWDTREALADMPAKNAVIMDNWFPGTDKVTLRLGTAEHVTGLGGSVETLLEYTPLTGSGKLFGARGGNIYDVTTAGAVGSAAVTGKSNARWQQVQIGTAGGQFLLCMNGADAPLNFNGSAWATTPAITGPTAASLIWCNLHQRRLWVGEKESLTAWYLPVNSIGGAASSFSMAGVARLGGYIMAMGTWTRDAGDGVDDVANQLSDKDGAKRKDAAKSLGKVLGDNAPLFALITNTLAKEKEIEDKWRHYSRPQSYRNLSNQVEDGVVDALVGAVKGCFPQLSHRYYALKAKWFGVEVLDYWDRNAPLPDDDDRKYSWEQARDTVLGAYGAFSPDMAAVGKRFFDNAWIDAPVRPGKSPGAFAHPTVPSVHPYLLVNFLGKTRDVMTLAHELGHGVHQVLAGVQGPLMADTPLTLAETASVFGEMLTFRAMLEAETAPKSRRIMLASKVEDMINTVVRQVAFYEFESLLHDERRRGELSPDRIGELWMSVQKDSLGPAFRYDDEYRHFWSYIPHFVHSPFYVYAYAFGDCLVNSLYSVYAKGGIPDFPTKYLDMLRAGGTLRHSDLLAPFGLDAGNPDFWRQGLDVVIGFIDELEAM